MPSVHRMEQAECSEEEGVIIFKTEDVLSTVTALKDKTKVRMNTVVKIYCCLPMHVTHRELWHLESCAVDNELRAFGLLKNFTKTLSAASAQVTASLHKVDILRSWLDRSVFEDYQMKIVS